MIVFVDDNRQCVSLVGMTTAQFLSLGEVLKQARKSPCPYVRELSAGLHLSCRWVMNTYQRSMSLLHLSWEEILVLEAFIVSWRTYEKTEAELDDILEALDAAVERITAASQKSVPRGRFASNE